MRHTAARSAGLLLTALGLAACAGVRAVDVAPGGRAAGRNGLVLVAGLGRVTPIRIATDQLLPPVRLPGFSYAMAVTPDGRRAFVASFMHDGSGLVTPIRIASRTAGTPVQVPPQPVSVAVSPDGRTVYVASQIDGRNQYPGRITPIDVATGKAGRPIRVGIDPGPILFTPDGSKAYVVNYGFNSQGSGTYLTPITVATGRAGRPIAIPSSDGTNVAMTPDGRTIYVTGTVAPGPPPTTAGPAGPSSPGGPGPAQVAESRTRGTAARPAGAKPGRLIPISTVTDRAGKPIKLPGSPGALAISPDGTVGYVLDDSGPGTGRETALPVSLATGRAVRVGAGSYLVAFTPDSRTAYVLDTGTVTPIRVADDSAERPVRVARFPVAIAFARDSRIAYVLCTSSTVGPSSVTPITVPDLAGRPIPVGRAAMALAIAP